MAAADPRAIRRIMLAVTETSPLHDLWRVAIEHMADESVELVALCLTDDRWNRAASLPFTHEISRLSGRRADFTSQRAEQINRDVLGRRQRELEQLAAQKRLTLAFEILSEHRAERIHQLVGRERDIVIAPALFRSRPVYAELSRLKCRVLLVDTEE